MLRRPTRRTRQSDTPIPSTLPVLTLPRQQVLLPGAALSIQLYRKDNLELLQTVLTRAERSNTPPVLAVAPLRPPPRGNALSKLGGDRGEPQAPNDNSSDEEDANTAQKPSSKRSLAITLPTDRGQSSGDGKGHPNRASVEEIFEYACAARIIRIESISSTTTSNGQTRTDKGYVAVLEGLCRVHLDRFTQVGFPYFEAQVTPHPRSEDDEPIPVEALEKMLNLTTNVLELLSPASDSNNNRRINSLASASGALSSMAVKQLRQILRGFSPDTADEISDILMSTLFPSSRPLSFPAKLTHLSLTSAKERIGNLNESLQALIAELEYSKNISDRYNENIQRRTKEMVLRGLLEAIHQELRALRKEDNDENGRASPPPMIRIVRQGGPGTPRSNASGPPQEAEEDEEEDELAALEKKIQESTMPEDAMAVATREFKRLKSIPPQSIEHSGIRNYLDWLLDLPWGKTSYDDEANKIIDQDFLKKARKQLDDDHFGIDKVKERLLQYLAVLRLRNEAFDVAEAARKESEAVEEQQEQRKKEEEEEEKYKQEAADGAKSGGPTSQALVRAPRVGKRQQGDVAQPPTSKATASTQSTKRAKKTKPVMKDKSPILLLLGPPGVGKTSIVKSLAAALGRPYERISLAGARDEAMLRGFRRTYVGSMPGVIVQALRKAKVNNPIILLDEIDKLGSGNTAHGDPSAAMLEILDPEQNFAFNDHYINTPIDLSSVLFVATANDISTLSPPLRDRMEIIQLSGYADVEKLEIAKRHLLPKQIKANQLQPGHVKMADEVLLDVINKYCGGESGVRTLERQIGSVCRWKAVEFATVRDSIPRETRPSLTTTDLPGYNPVVAASDLPTILGIDQLYEPELIASKDEVRPGTSTGLAYQGSGNGGILQIEATLMPGKGNLRLTGSLGEVISESGQLALSWVKANAFDVGLVASKSQDIMRDVDVHLHMPSGAIRKDGPSAGLAITMALISLFSHRAIDPTIAMTGEITLTGRVTAVGGIKEKVLGAHRAGVRTVILPLRNQKDVGDLPESVRKDIKIVYVQNIYQALEIVLPSAHSDSQDTAGEASRRLGHPERL